MATIGITSKPTANQVFTGLNTDTQVAARVTMTEDGTLTHVGVWMNGKDATVTAYCCVWDNSGNLVAQSDSFTAADQPLGVGNSALYYKELDTPYEAESGDVLYIGFARNPSGAAQWGHNSSGTHYRDDNTGSYPDDASFSSSSGSIGAYATYTTNAVPTAPSITSPKGGTIVTDTTPDLKFKHNDPDGDACASYDLQVDNNSDFSSPVWSISNQTSGISGVNITRAYGGSALTRGTTYYWRARTNDGTGDGPWSTGATFKVNQLPSPTKTSPTTNALATIWNLASDAQLWDTTLFYSKPRFTWTFSDADGHAQSAFRVKVYSASVGGSTLYDSGKVASSAKTHDSTWAGDYDTAYYWTIEVWDALDDTSSESSRTAFKMLWSQAWYETPVTGGTASRSWAISSTKSGTGNVALLFRSATGTNGSGAGSWKTSIGAVTPNAHLNVLVRLGATTSGSSPALEELVFTYESSGVLPDNWKRTPSGSGWALDTDRRRYGSRSFKSTVGTTGDHHIRPYRIVEGDDIEVEPEATYTFSAFVKTESTVTGNNYIRLIAYSNNTGASIPASNGSADYVTTDTSSAPDGWQRLVYVFTTDLDTDSIECYVEYKNADTSATGDIWWVDAVQLEEGPVATPWKPGMVGRSVVLDVGGVSVDGSAGGTFRLRGHDSGVIELGENGLESTGNVKLLDAWANAYDPAKIHARFYQYFKSRSTFGDFGDFKTVSETAAGSSSGTSTVLSPATPLTLGTGANAAGGGRVTEVSDGTPWVLRSGFTYIIRGIVRTSGTLSTSGQRYQLWFGMSDRPRVADASDPILGNANHFMGFRYRDDNGSGGQWEAGSNDGAGGSALFTPSGVTVAISTAYLLEIVATTTEIKFYIEGVLVATHTTDLPTAAMGFTMGIRKTVGTTAMNAVFEWVEIMAIRGTIKPTAYPGFLS